MMMKMVKMINAGESQLEESWSLHHQSPSLDLHPKDCSPIMIFFNDIFFFIFIQNTRSRAIKLKHHEFFFL